MNAAHCRMVSLTWVWEGAIGGKLPSSMCNRHHAVHEQSSANTISCSTTCHYLLRKEPSCAEKKSSHCHSGKKNERRGYAKDWGNSNHAGEQGDGSEKDTVQFFNMWLSRCYYTKTSFICYKSLVDKTRKPQIENCSILFGYWVKYVTDTLID